MRPEPAPRGPTGQGTPGERLEDSASSAQERLDDRTVAYVLATRPAFEDLKQVAAQLAGLLVLVAAGSCAAGPEHPILTVAHRILAEVDDVLGAAAPSPAALAHHRLLVRAAASLRRACVRAQERLSPGGDDLDAILALVRDAYAHLGNAARRLPGFQLVALERACCSRGPSGGVRRCQRAAESSALLLATG